MLKFGIALNMPAEENRIDATVVREHMAFGDLAEPLGFDSLFVLEHHFSGYVLSPAPLQMLAYYAGRTNRLELGTAVIVLPWHDPIRVAEQISLLDIMCDGRCLFAFGRGRGEQEFSGFRVSMNEARARFAEAAEIVVGALANEVFEYAGEFYQIPRLSIRPRPMSKPQERFYAPATGQESTNLIARLGFGMLAATQKSWTDLGTDITRFHELTLAAGHKPKAPIVLASVSVAKSRQEAHERALEFLGREWAMIDAHYRYSEGNLAGVQGYESYVNTQQFFGQLADSSFRDQATMDYANLQLVGTPDDCIQQIEELVYVTGLEHLVLEFSYGNLPYREAESNMKLFANDVIPSFQKG